MMSYQSTQLCLFSLSLIKVGYKVFTAMDFPNFNFETNVEPPHPEQGQFGSMRVSSDLINIMSVMTEDDGISVLVSFDGLEKKVFDEICNISDQSIAKSLVNQFPQTQIELGEEMLVRHVQDVGKPLDQRRESGFLPLDPETTTDENGWPKPDYFKRYKVHWAQGSQVYLNANVALELALCLDKFNSEYEIFKAEYLS